MTLTPDTLRIGERYNWKNQPERLVYMGQKRYPGDGRTWHQFAKVETPTVCWSEVLESDVSSFEVSEQVQHLQTADVPRGDWPFPSPRQRSTAYR